MAEAANDTGRADRSNWRTAPFSRWAFHHVRELMPVAEVPADPAGARDLPASPRSLDGFAMPAPGGRTFALDEALAATSGDGIVVLHEGRLVYEAYANGMTAQTPHILMSATKSVTGLVAGALAGRGEVDLDAAVSAYVPETAATPYEDATLRQLMDMRAGVRLNVEQLAAYAAATGWEAPGPQPADLHEFYATLAGTPGPHDGPFAYVSANTDLLGWALERAAGRPFAELVSELIWKPMGAAQDGFITTDDRGAARCTGGLNATVRDFARLGLLVAEDGRRDGRAVIPAAWIADMAGGGDARAWAEGEFAAGFRGMTMRYRSGWYVVDDAPQTLFAMGIHGQNLFVDRANRIVVAKVSSQPQPVDFRVLPLTHRLYEEIRRVLLES
ncbi:serine hydrolase [Phenylobacterium sp.]|uniref:serine hydrolase domain-containing protein n=1 Tax=Phenylobacterium sp. TaxID=1871053 RepID=UPI0025CF3459|nr:serine hydrolase [Phenylobacterium sp.]